MFFSLAISLAVPKLHWPYLYKRTQCMSCVLRRTLIVLTTAKSCTCGLNKIDVNFVRILRSCMEKNRESATQIAMKYMWVSLSAVCSKQSSPALIFFFTRIDDQINTARRCCFMLSEILIGYEATNMLTSHPVCNWPCYWQRHVGVS